MLNCKSRYSILFRTIALVVVLLFLANDMAFAFADPDKSALAPPLATEPQGNTLLHNEWIVADIGKLIYPILKLAEEGKLQNPRDILIPLINKHMRNREGILPEGFDIDGIEEVREYGKIVGFSLPVTRNNVPVYRIIYNLQGGDKCIELKDGTNIYARIMTEQGKTFTMPLPVLPKTAMTPPAVQESPSSMVDDDSKGYSKLKALLAKIRYKDTVISEKDIFSGDAALTLTRYCSRNCSFCYFDHTILKPGQNKDPANVISYETLDRFLQEFSPAPQPSRGLGRLLNIFSGKKRPQDITLTGDGEPFLEFEKVLYIIKNAHCRILSIKTNGCWGDTEDSAISHFKSITEAANNNPDIKTIEINISADAYHENTADTVRIIDAYLASKDDNNIKVVGKKIALSVTCHADPHFEQYFDEFEATLKKKGISFKGGIWDKGDEEMFYFEIARDRHYVPWVCRRSSPLGSSYGMWDDILDGRRKLYDFLTKFRAEYGITLPIQDEPSRRDPYISLKDFEPTGLCPIVECRYNGEVIMEGGVLKASFLTLGTISMTKDKLLTNANNNPFLRAIKEGRMKKILESISTIRPDLTERIPFEVNDINIMGWLLSQDSTLAEYVLKFIVQKDYGDDKLTDESKEAVKTIFTPTPIDIVSSADIRADVERRRLRGDAEVPIHNTDGTIAYNMTFTTFEYSASARIGILPEKRGPELVWYAAPYSGGVLPKEENIQSSSAELAASVLEKHGESKDRLAAIDLDWQGIRKYSHAYNVVIGLLKQIESVNSAERENAIEQFIKWQEGYNIKKPKFGEMRNAPIEIIIGHLANANLYPEHREAIMTLFLNLPPSFLEKATRLLVFASSTPADRVNKVLGISVDKIKREILVEMAQRAYLMDDFTRFETIVSVVEDMRDSYYQTNEVRENAWNILNSIPDPEEIENYLLDRDTTASAPQSTATFGVASGGLNDIDRRAAIARILAEHPEFTDKPQELLKYLDKNHPGILEVIHEDKRLRYLERLLEELSGRAPPTILPKETLPNDSSAITTQDITENNIFELFKKGTKYIWIRSTKPAKLYMVTILAKELGKDAGALNTGDFEQLIPALNNKSLTGLLGWAKREFKYNNPAKALKELKRYLGIEEVEHLVTEDITENNIFELFKKGTKYIWIRSTKPAKLYMVTILAKELGKDAGALNTGDFEQFIPAFNNKVLYGLLEWAGREFECNSYTEALRELKRYLGIGDLRKEKKVWKEKPGDWNNVCEILNTHMKANVTPSAALTYLNTAHFNKETDLALAAMVQAGNSAAREAMVRAYLSTVRSYAHRYSATYPDIGYDEFFSEGSIALQRSVEAFDPSRNIAFSAYVGGFKRRGGYGRKGRIEGTMLDLVRQRRGTRRKNSNGSEKQYKDPNSDKGREEGYMANVPSKDSKPTLSDDTIKEIKAILRQELESEKLGRNIEIYISYIQGEKQYEIAKRLSLSTQLISLICRKCASVIKASSFGRASGGLNDIDRRAAIARILAEHPEFTDKPQELLKYLDKNHPGILEVIHEDKRLRYLERFHEPSPKTERIHAINFRDIVNYIKAKEDERTRQLTEEKAVEEPRPTIVALGTSWIKAYDRNDDGKFKYLQGQDLNELIISIRSYCESKGIPLIVDDDDKLPARIKSEREKMSMAGAKVVVLAGKDTVSSDEFAMLRNDAKGAFVFGVDNKELTEDSYIMLVEMLKIALKFSVSLEVSQDTTPIKIMKDDKLHIYILIPPAQLMKYEELHIIYQVQQSA